MQIETTASQVVIAAAVRGRHDTHSSHLIDSDGRTPSSTRGYVGGQEDMIIDIAVQLAQSRSEVLP